MMSASPLRELLRTVMPRKFRVVVTQGKVHAASLSIARGAPPRASCKWRNLRERKGTNRNNKFSLFDLAALAIFFPATLTQSSLVRTVRPSQWYGALAKTKGPF
jgi:hypothetical protein